VTTALAPTRSMSLALDREAMRKFLVYFLNACETIREYFEGFEAGNTRKYAASIISDRVFPVAISMQEQLLDSNINDASAEVQRRILLSLYEAFVDMGAPLSGLTLDRVMNKTHEDPTPLMAEVLTLLLARLGSIRPNSEEITSLIRTPARKQTNAAFRAVEESYSKTDLFSVNYSGDAYVYDIANWKTQMKTGLSVMLTPSEAPDFFPPATLEELYRKLTEIGSDLVFPFAVAMSRAIENDQACFSIDDFIKSVGIEPRDAADREKIRRVMWDSLKIFSQTRVLGTVQGRYRDKNGNPIKYYENSTMIMISATYYPHGKPIEKHEVPTHVALVAGQFYYRNRGNGKFLSALGDLRKLAEIPCGKPSGKWARTLGVFFLQYAREHASECKYKSSASEADHQRIKFPPTTRRELFTRLRPDPNPFEILGGDHPKRAQEYWDGAIDELRVRKAMIAIEEPLDLSRKGWQDEWLDHVIELRPHPENVLVIEEIKNVLTGAKDFNRKKGRRKKDAPPEAS
jgi:hypothetical protein